MKFIFSAIALGLIYLLGVGRVLHGLDAIDKALKAAYDEARPPEPPWTPPVEVIKHRRPWTIYRHAPARSAPDTLPDTLEML